MLGVDLVFVKPNRMGGLVRRDGNRNIEHINREFGKGTQLIRIGIFPMCLQVSRNKFDRRVFYFGDSILLADRRERENGGHRILHISVIFDCYRRSTSRQEIDAARSLSPPRCPDNCGPYMPARVDGLAAAASLRQWS